MSVDQDLRPAGSPVSRLAAAALLGYAAVRVVGMAVFGVAAAVRGKDALHLLKGRWDAVGGS